MCIVGAGPIGAELGQAFQRLGTQVTFVIRGSKFLPREDRDAAQFLLNQLKKDGCKFLYDSEISKLELYRMKQQSADGLNQIKMTLKDDVKRDTVYESKIFDTVMFAIGRTPNVASLNLDEAKIDFSAQDGIYANEYLQTTNLDVYAVGDCLASALSKEQAKEMPGCGPQFTHNSDVHARSIFKNALLGEKHDRRK